MQNANYQNEAQLNEALKAWDAPAIPSALDQRVFASYRQQTQRQSLWQRFFTASIPVPAPLLAATAVLFVVVGAGAFVALTPAPAASTSIPVVNTITKTEIVEVPVIKERVVTRVVYVEKPVTVKAAQPLVASGNPPPSEIKLASHVAGDNAYTNVDLSGFQPVEEMKVRIIKGSATNEQ